MKHTLHRTGLFAVVVCLAFAARAHADSDLSSSLLDRETVLAAAADVTTNRYPNADDVLVDEYVRVEYEADGTAVTWDDEYVKVLTEKGKRSGGTRSFHFTLPYETVEILWAEVLRPDGSSVPVDSEQQSRIMINRSQMSANIYNPNSKILQLSIPGLEIGDMTHIMIRRNTVKPRVPDTWSDYSVFEYTTPMKHVIYDVIGPNARPLQSVVLKAAVEGTVQASTQDAGTRTRYLWEVTDVPRTFAEPNMPPLYTVAQRLLVSTIESWQDISRWYWNLSLPHLETVTPAMKAKTEELIAGAKDRRETIERLFQFVSQQVRYMGITTETEAPGYEPHDVSVTFENRYGVCRDKAALLVAMLRQADLPGYPVLIHVGPRKDEEVPQPFFNHAIVAVAEEDGSYLLMDPTDENTTELLPAYLCNRSYLVAHPDGERLRTSPIVPAEENLLRIESHGALDEEGTLALETTLTFRGINDNWYRGYFARLKPEERRRFFEGVLKRRLAGARLTDFHIRPLQIQDASEPLTVRLQYKAADYLVEGGAYRMAALPWLGGAVGAVNFVIGKTGLTKRKYPLSTEIACGVEETFSIRVPETVGTPVAMPAYSPQETNTLTFSQAVAIESNVLAGTSTFLLKAVEFSPKEYLELKRMLKDIEYDRRQRPLFRRDATAEDADVRVLSSMTDIRLDSASAWTTTREVQKEILTYAGKKANAELKINFNPVWQDVRLEAASVSAADGTVRTVAQQEINIMDAGWVGSAPRYPAEKTMVVSLPGVEVGSVINYRLVTVTSNAPFFSTLKSFTRHDPVDLSLLRVSCPTGLALTVVPLHTEGVEHRREERGHETVYEWSVSGLRAVPKEDSQPPLWMFNPAVMVSAGAWADYAREVREGLTAASTGQPQAEAEADRLTSGTLSAVDKTLAIRDYVARNIRAVGPSLHELPLSAITPADVTLAQGYGNSADVAVLLHAMLTAAGLEAEFIPVSSWAPRVDALAEVLFAGTQRELFDSVLVRTRLGEEAIYLNDTDQYAMLGATPHDGQMALDVQGARTTVHATAGMEDRMETEYALHVDATGDTLITITNRYYGMAHAAFHRQFAEMPPEQRRRHYQELVAEVSQAAEAQGDLVTQTAAHPGVKAFAVHVPRYAVRSGAYLYLGMPGSGADLLSLRAEHRKTPWYRGAPARADVLYRINLPPAVSAVPLLPNDMDWTAPAGLGEVRSDTTAPGADAPLQVRISRRADLHPAVIQVWDYPALLEFDRRFKHPEAWTVMAVTDEQAADTP